MTTSLFSAVEPFALSEDARAEILRALGERWDHLIRNLDNSLDPRWTSTVLVQMCAPYVQPGMSTENIQLGMLLLRDALSALRRWETDRELVDCDDWLLGAPEEDVTTFLCRDVDLALRHLLDGFRR